MRGLITLGLAVAGCAAIVRLGPAFAERITFLLGDAQRSMAAVETLYTLIIFGPLLLVAVVGGALSRLNALDLGKRPALMLLAGTLIGCVAILAAVGLAKLAGSVATEERPLGGAGLLVWGSLAVLFAATVEEVYFRGWLQPVIARDHGLSAALLVSALAFAALHVMGGARSPITLVNLFLGGLLFGLLAARGGGLAAPVSAHFAWNWTEQIGLGLDPNPGFGSFGALADLELDGQSIWGGSDEGLNASIAMTIALLAMLVPLLALSRGSLAISLSARSPAPAR